MRGNTESGRESDTESDRGLFDELYFEGWPAVLSPAPSKLLDTYSTSPLIFTPSPAQPQADQPSPIIPPLVDNERQKARNKEYKRKYRESLTEAQKAEVNARERENYAKRREKMTEEEKAKARENRAKKLAEMTEEQKAKANAKARENRAKRNATMTEVDKVEKRRKEKIREQRRRDKKRAMPPEEREAKRKQERIREQFYRDNKTEEQKKRKKEYQKNYRRNVKEAKRVKKLAAQTGLSANPKAQTPGSQSDVSFSKMIETQRAGLDNVVIVPT